MCSSDFPGKAARNCRIIFPSRERIGAEYNTKEEKQMPNLTAKELAGLSDQLDFEKVLRSKYQAAVQETQDQQLKTSFQQYADQHRQNFENLLNFLQ
jgi:hypothetical protein